MGIEISEEAILFKSIENTESEMESGKFLTHEQLKAKLDLIFADYPETLRIYNPGKPDTYSND